MTATLWAFRDARGRVRITPTDPTAILESAGLTKSMAQAPGGFSMRDLRRLFETSEQMLTGDTGGEGFIEFTIEGLSPEMLGYLMTPPQEPVV